MNDLYQQYVKTLKKLADVEYSIALLHWDKEVNLPPKGAVFRSQQIATLSGIAHELFTDQKFGSLLDELNASKKELGSVEAKNVELSLKDYRKKQKYSTEFVIKSSKAASEAYHAWIKAREKNDYNFFKDALAQLVEIKREESSLLGYQNHPYNALLDQYEADCTVGFLDALFSDVKVKLLELVSRIRSKNQVDDGFLKKHYDRDKQWNFGLEVLRNMGYDFEAGRQDLSAHPFTINFSPQDVRVTTRVDENNFGSMTWSCIHEGGHALYEQGLPSDQYGLPSGRYISLGIHESQSRLWENNVGRSLPYWKAHYPKLQLLFPKNLKSVSLTDFYKGINKIQASPIRTESDELHYHFHIMIRYEIEKGLIEGSIQTDNLDRHWNEQYQQYLGLEITDDNSGILQDIHWSHGSIGYFPTYSLGSFYAAQFFTQAEKDIPGLITNIEAGKTQALLDWLRQHIHRHGKQYNADELCRKITGKPLDFQTFLDYAEKKFAFIYA